MRIGFLIGTGRCGSTLVLELLARHRNVGFVSNLDGRLPAADLKGRWNGRAYRSLPARFSIKGGLRFGPSEAFELLDRQVAPIVAKPFRDLFAEDVTPWLDRRFRRFFEERARTQKATVFVHKFTGWPRSGFVQRIFPDAKFIHIVRDGRAVASSFLQMPWWLGYEGPWGWQWGPLPEPYAAEWEDSGRSFVVLAGIAWKVLIDAFEAARARVPATQWMEVRYEDFLADPRAHVRDMLEFLGLESSPAFEASCAKNVVIPARRDAFRHELGPRDLERLEASLRDHLRRFGYETAPEGAHR